MKIIFLTLMYSEKQLQHAFRYSKRGVQMAAHTFQSRLCRGLRAIEGASLNVVSCAPVGSFPMNYKRLVIPGEKSGNDTAVGFVDLPKVKYTLQEQLLYTRVKGMLREDEPAVLLIYSLHLPFMRVAAKLKQHFPKLKVCLIQTDAVPGVNDMEKRMTKEAHERGQKLLRLSSCCDGYVILTEYLQDALQIGNRPYTVVEGIAGEVPSVTPATLTAKNAAQRTFFYSGSLNSAFGFNVLAQAFLQLEDKLVICGAGDYLPQLLEDIRNNPKKNIEYLGYLTPEEVSKRRCTADFLINPRQPSGTYTKYSFPSKTMEYLASGVPTVMYRLEGIPAEYDAYLNYLTGTTAQEMADQLRQLCAADYTPLAEKAAAGREFVLKNKNEYVQAKKIYDLLNDLVQ